jgi:hypothetical protein
MEVGEGEEFVTDALVKASTRTSTHQQPPLPAVETDLWTSTEFLCENEGRVEVEAGE